MTLPTREELDELEALANEHAGWGARPHVDPHRLLALIRAARELHDLRESRRALESESRPQSQGVPTGREHLVAAHECIIELQKVGVDIKQYQGKDIIAVAIAAAYERGRSQAAGDGWVALRFQEDRWEVLVPNLGAAKQLVRKVYPYARFHTDEDGYWAEFEGNDVASFTPPSDSGKEE